MKFGIEKKMIFGYLPLILVILAIALLSAYSLNELNAINRSILEEDAFLVQTAGEMEDALLAQESYGRRYLILESPQMLDLFQQRNMEFKELVGKVGNLPSGKELPMRKLNSLHEEFNALYTDTDGILSGKLTKEFDEQVREKFSGMTALLQEITQAGKQNQYLKMQKANGIGVRTFRLMVLLSTLGIVLGLAAVSMITRSISQAISRLKRTTEIIAEGRYDHLPQVDTGDELQDLSGSICSMAQQLSQLEKFHLDCNPLTRMPGGYAIENSLVNRLENDTDLAFCTLDLDNFKAYNDRYGYAKGNEIIRMTALLIQGVVSEYGCHDDFTGHIGGDDFAVITDTDRYEMICKTIIQRFDEHISFFYNQSDREKGLIVSKNRQGRKMSFPIMSVSIAVVTKEPGKYMNHIEIGEMAAELKEYAKSIPGSVFVVNRRGKREEYPYAGDTALKRIK